MSVNLQIDVILLDLPKLSYEKECDDTLLHKVSLDHRTADHRTTELIKKNITETSRRRVM